jgi:TPR repeat protein
MPFSMKIWQVQGKDLREIHCEALSDEQRLQDWLAKETKKDDGPDWVIDNPKPVLASAGKNNGQRKSTPPPSQPTAFQQTKTRAEQGDAAAQASLGFMYEMGIEVPVDGAEAVKWYRKAAEQGNSRAKCNLDQIAAHGFMFEPGKHVPANGAEAVHWCKKAAEQGDARAQFNLGQMYEWGDGVPQDSGEAEVWFRKAAQRGEAVAQYMLGLCYCNGRGVTQNTTEAVRWWNLAASQGVAAAQYKLGLCYCNAQGVPQDYTKAVRWFRKAAEQGEAMAQGKLGDAYYIGVGVPSNHAEAVKWYRAAAEQGVAAAQRHLGIMYGLGQGVQQDYAEAYMWYTLAAEQHDNNAVHNRDSIAEFMTPAQIAEGQRLSQDFLGRRASATSQRSNGQIAAIADSPPPEPELTPSDPVVRAGGKDILGIDLLPIGRRVATAAGGCIDLLAIDGQANLVVLELKRDKAPHEIMVQTLDHASWVKSLSYEQIETITKEFTGKLLGQAFSEHFGKAIPETVNASHSMVILASDWDDSSMRIMQYLAKQHGVPIHVLFMGLFKTKSGEFLGCVRR